MAIVQLRPTSFTLVNRVKRFYSRQTNPSKFEMNEINKGVHFKTGSPEPKFPNDGKLQLLSMRFCPFAARVHLTLNIKKVPYHVAYIDLHQKPEWLTKYSPRGKVPGLLIPGVSEPLIESMAISEYLEEKYPEPALYPKDPLGKARDRIFIERFNSVVFAMVRLLFKPPSEAEKEVQKVVSFLKFLDEEYARRGTKFLFGNAHPGMVDLMIWPWFEKMPYAAKKIGKIVDTKNFANVTKWEMFMLEQEAVKGFYVEPKDCETFLETRARGEPAYDLLAKL